MQEIIEIKRKEFTVLSNLDENQKIVERKGKTYLMVDYSSNKEGFLQYINSENKLRTSGIRIPKLYVYDKNKMLVVKEYIEGESVLDLLLKEDLKDEIFEEVFTINFMMKRNKIKLDFDPINFRFFEGKLYYISDFCKVFDEKASFEKEGIFLWFYSPELVTHLSKRGLPVDQKRMSKVPGYLNKQIALTVVKYYR